MAFRFNNPLRQAANLQTQLNRGLGGFGQVQSALNNFNEIEKSISRISSSVGNIAGNTGSIRETITRIGSAGDLLNTLGGNSSISNTIRSVSALTRDIQTLMPGNSRVASQAATLSRRAEDLFSNAQRNINSIRNISGGVTDVLNGTLDVGNLANRSLGQLTGGLNLDAITGGLNLNSLTRANQISGTVSNALNQIAAAAPELKNITNQPINVVPRSVAELTRSIGERFDGLREQFESQLSETSFDNYVNRAFVPLSQSPLGQFADFDLSAFAGPRTGAGNSYSRVANPLRDYSSFNYIITLGILSSQEYNNPDVYRSGGGFNNYVIKQGGGQYEKRYQTFDEEQGNGHAEYFIDDLEMDAVIAPNPNTNVALGTALTFKVTEPYSMGNFIESIIGAAATAGFANYLDAPFCIRIDFVGWDEFGRQNATYVRNPIFIPIKLTKVDFNVDGKGSIYDCKAVPMSETGLGDDINEIKTPVNVNGDFVHTTLETGARSLTQVMNDRVAGLEEAGVIAPYDRYVIVFPKSRESLRDYLAQDIIREDALRIDIAERVEDFIGANTAALTDEEAAQQAISGISGGGGQSLTIEQAAELAQLQLSLQQRNANIIQATISSVGRMYAKLKTFAEDTSEMNAIGLSTLVEDTATGGNQAHGSQAGTVDPEDSRGDPARNSADLTTAEKSRDYQFNQGMTITEVIERMVVSSEYARDRATAPAQNGIKDWFKIDTYTFIEENPETEAQIGRPPRVYVYSVIPYEADEAKFNAPSERPANTEGLKAAAAKEYNYIYTGKNEDILNFDISFNNAFLQTAFANFGQNAAGVAGGASTSSTSVDRSTGSRLPPFPGGPASNTVTGQVAESTNLASGGFGDAVGSGDMKRRIAEMFHDRITNQVTDMVTAEMQIFGDPFFIPQEMGNFVARQGDSPNTTEEGTMTYQQSEVFVVVNFATPFDYQVEGATIEFPKVVPQFSGLFSVWAVTNNFSGGKFTQTLKMIRRRGQDDPATDENTGPVQESPENDITGNSGSDGSSETGNQGANVGSGSGNTPTTPNPHPPVTAPNVTGAGAVSTNPEGRRFGSMDQAINAARAYQQNNPGYSYAIQQGENGGWSVAPRPSTSTAPTATDLTSNVTNSAGTQAAQPTSPAC